MTASIRVGSQITSYPRTPGFAPSLSPTPVSPTSSSIPFVLPAPREKCLSSLREGTCDRGMLHGECRGTWLEVLKPDRRRGTELAPSLRARDSRCTYCTHQKLLSQILGSKSQSQPKPQLLLPELTLDVTCCSADTHHQPRRSRTRRASPRPATRQEATQKCRQSMSIG